MNEAAVQAADGVTEVLVTAQREGVWSVRTGNTDSRTCIKQTVKICLWDKIAVTQKRITSVKI